MAVDDELSSSEMNRLSARLGVELAHAVSATRGALASSEAVAAMAKFRLATEYLTDQGRPFPPEELQEIWSSIVEKNSGVPEFFRSFYACMRLSGETERRLPYGLHMTELHFLARWATYGLPVFSLTHSLVAALLLTKPPEYDPESFHLPFPAFSISLPAGLVPFANGESCETIHVHLSQGYVDGNRETVFRLELRGRTAYFVYQEPVAKLGSVEREQAEWSDLDLVEGDYRAIEAGIRIVRNLAAWLEVHDRGQPEGAPKKKGKHRRNREPGEAALPTTWIIGREVKLSPELRRMATEVVLGEKRSAPGWRLRVQFVVAPHWRWQACGKGRLERKRIWIEPFWKGPVGAEAWSHVYTVGEKKEGT